MLDTIRQDFPILNQEVHNKPLVYLDSAASAQKPQSVIDSMLHYYQHDNANVHRGAHTLGDRATHSFEAARDTVQAFLNAPSRKEIIWTKGTTEAINLLANGLSGLFAKDDEIIVSDMEHHANIVPWQMMAERTGAVLRVLEVNDQGELDHAQLLELITPRTKVLAMTHVSNVLGNLSIPLKHPISLP